MNTEPDDTGRIPYTITWDLDAAGKPIPSSMKMHATAATPPLAPVASYEDILDANAPASLGPFGLADQGAPTPPLLDPIAGGSDSIIPDADAP